LRTPLNVGANVSGIDLKKVEVGIVDINGVMSDRVVLTIVKNETGISGSYLMELSWVTQIVYVNDEPVTILINQSEPWLYIPAYYRNSTLGWSEAMLALNKSTFELEFIILNGKSIKPNDGEVMLRIFKMPRFGQLTIENSRVFDISSLEIERRIAMNGVYLVYIYAEDEFGNNVTKMNYIEVDNSAVKLPPLPGHARSPKDIDGDYIIEDFNGNGILDFDDVVELYKNIKWIRQNYPLDRVDQNEDGMLNFDDVVILFKRI